ncbi:hypothetical protein B4916_21870 [Yersinia intermedia]|nr:hypothetical protein B4916_21870 [Yersinia intermedia]
MSLLPQPAIEDIWQGCIIKRKRHSGHAGVTMVAFHYLAVIRFGLLTLPTPWGLIPGWRCYTVDTVICH